MLLVEDFNAKNETRRNNITDSRGEELMEMVVIYGWELINEENQGLLTA